MTEKTKDKWKVLFWVALMIFIIWIIASDSRDNTKIQKGDLFNTGGTPTIRKTPPVLTDDPVTSNDESNDQPIGYYGTETVEACNLSSGNCYDLDVDIWDDYIERAYFSKGGWVDFYDSYCDDEYCWGEDENGTEWEFFRYDY